MYALRAVIIPTLLTIGSSHRSRYHQHQYVSFITFLYKSSLIILVIVLYSLTKFLRRIHTEQLRGVRRPCVSANA